MLISIVIPTLNESACIEHTLTALQIQEQPFEIIVADGGSADDTCNKAGMYARVIPTQRGRASQMNAGAADARGDVLLFLHADTHLPPNALHLIRQAVADNAVAGNFRLKFDTSSPLLSTYSFFTRFQFPRFSFGDRSLFVQTELFEHIGGFASIPIFEDLDLVSRLTKKGEFAYLHAYVVTAARRFEKNGLAKQQLLNAYLWIRYLLGTPPAKLAHHYTYEISSPE
ncbi:MAG: TIGR04283 family arsenosugar biosynthesis glycosyltransferase [Rhodothermales bacterium]